MPDLRHYDDWLSLPDDARDHFHRQWDVHQHEMFWVPMLAAARLASRSHLPVTDIYAGVWHGGEYVLHLTVPRDSLASLPRPLEQTFEGFRVIWMGDTPDFESTTAFTGKWLSKGDFGRFEISVTEGESGINVTCVDQDTDEALDVLSPRVHRSQLSFATRSAERSLFHSLDLDTGEKFNHRVTRCQIARHAPE